MLSLWLWLELTAARARRRRRAEPSTAILTGPAGRGCACSTCDRARAFASVA